MMAVLLQPSVTSLPATARTLTDLTSLEIASGGNYTAAAGAWSSGAAVQLPDFTVNYDDASGVSELSAPATTLIGTKFLTVSFRWAVITSGTSIVTAVDYGTTQTLTGQPLVLTIAESATISGSFPVISWTRDGA
jgi:hypothetical protein